MACTQEVPSRPCNWMVNIFTTYSFRMSPIQLPWQCCSKMPSTGKTARLGSTRLSQLYCPMADYKTPLSSHDSPQLMPSTSIWTETKTSSFRPIRDSKLTTMRLFMFGKIKGPLHHRSGRLSPTAGFKMACWILVVGLRPCFQISTMTGIWIWSLPTRNDTKAWGTHPLTSLCCATSEQETLLPLS